MCTTSAKRYDIVSLNKYKFGFVEMQTYEAKSRPEKKERCYAIPSTRL